jgi:hypothetical protein
LSLSLQIQEAKIRWALSVGAGNNFGEARYYTLIIVALTIEFLQGAKGIDQVEFVS